MIALSVLALALVPLSVTAQDFYQLGAPPCVVQCLATKLTELDSLAPGVDPYDTAALCSTSTFTEALYTCFGDHCVSPAVDFLCFSAADGVSVSSLQNATEVDYGRRATEDGCARITGSASECTHFLLRCRWRQVLTCFSLSAAATSTSAGNMTTVAGGGGMMPSGSSASESSPSSSGEGESATSSSSASESTITSSSSAESTSPGESSSSGDSSSSSGESSSDPSAAEAASPFDTSTLEPSRASPLSSELAEESSSLRSRLSSRSSSLESRLSSISSVLATATGDTLGSLTSEIASLASSAASASSSINSDASDQFASITSEAAAEIRGENAVSVASLPQSSISLLSCVVLVLQAEDTYKNAFAAALAVTVFTIATALAL